VHRCPCAKNGKYDEYSGTFSALRLFQLAIQSRRKSPVLDLESFRQTNCARHWPEDTPRHNLSEKTNDVWRVTVLVFLSLLRSILISWVKLQWKKSHTSMQHTLHTALKLVFLCSTWFNNLCKPSSARSGKWTGHAMIRTGIGCLQGLYKQLAFGKLLPPCSAFKWSLIPEMFNSS